MKCEVSTGVQEVETDVLVIGGGGAGLAAAVSAAEAGGRVIVAEKCNRLGGTSGLSIGSITACCTSYQIRQGIVDSPEALFEDMKKFNGEFDQYDVGPKIFSLALFRLYCGRDCLRLYPRLRERRSGYHFEGRYPGRSSKDSSEARNAHSGGKAL
jgi:glycine/D-amino acid oxidase-like deaminating enzyme